VFAGGCSLAAAEIVGDTDVDTITALLDASLLTRTRASRGTRFTMLDTIRTHAAALLQGLGSRAEAEAAHGEHYADLAETTPMKGAQALDGLAVIDADLDNLRLAYDRAIAAGDDTTALRIATPLYRYWYPRGLFREGHDRISGPLDRHAGHPALRADALRSIAGLDYLLGDHDAAVAEATAGIEQGRAAANLEAVLGCHTVLGLVAQRREDLSAARDYFEQSRALAEELGLELDVVVANTNLGEVARCAGDLDEARRRFELSVELHARVGGTSTYALLGLGDVARLQGRLDDADIAFQRAHDLSEATGVPHNVAMAVLGLASVAALRGRVEDAGRLLGRAAGMAAITAGDLHGTDGETYRETESVVLAALGSTRLAELIATGREEVGPA
jgi:non-specific serine/threonine protein kinase